MLILDLTFEIFHDPIWFHLRDAIKWFILTWMIIMLFFILILHSNSFPCFYDKLMLVLVKEYIFKKLKMFTFKEVRYEIIIKLFSYIFNYFLSYQWEAFMGQAKVFLWKFIILNLNCFFFKILLAELLASIKKNIEGLFIQIMICEEWRDFNTFIWLIKLIIFLSLWYFAIDYWWG